MLDKLRQHVLAWTTSAALTLTGFQIFAPAMVDWILDFAVVGLVFVAAKLAGTAPKS
jgi:hypothetical protein